MTPDQAARYRRLADKERWAAIIATCPIDTTTGCRLWPRAKSLGYGRIKFDGRLDLAHRVAYRLAVGPVPDGKVLDHLCRNPSCINADHLEPVTMRENILRGTGPTAMNAAKTHCVRGHDLTVTARVERGRRVCVECLKLKPSGAARRRAAKFAAVPAPPPAVERRLPGQGHAPLAGHDSQAGAA